jgi:signal transduction histidine kinase
MIEESASGDVASYAQKVLETSEGLLETVDKEREITKFLSDPPRLKPIDLESVVEVAASNVRDQYPNAEISVAVESTYRARTTVSIAQAIDELLENAIIHSNRERPTVDVWAEQSEDSVRIHVADDGPGIPEMERKVLTDEATIDPVYHGSGLGLWLVNLIVRQSNGVMEFEDRDDYGSVVKLQLPSA